MQFIAQLQLRQNPALAAKSDQLMAFLERHIGWNAVRGDLYEMYMQTFTEEELKTINDFYITSTGQKVLTIVPQLVQERNRLAMQRLQENIGELQQIMSEETAPGKSRSCGDDHNTRGFCKTPKYVIPAKAGQKRAAR